MKKIFLLLATLTVWQVTAQLLPPIITLKIKNDSPEVVYLLHSDNSQVHKVPAYQTLTLKLNPDDKIYTVQNGKKGRLLCIATPDMDGKVFFYSKL